MVAHDRFHQSLSALDFQQSTPTSARKNKITASLSSPTVRDEPTSSLESAPQLPLRGELRRLRNEVSETRHTSIALGQPTKNDDECDVVCHAQPNFQQATLRNTLPSSFRPKVKSNHNGLAPYWQADKGLQKSKLFAAKLNKAATIITSLVRRHLVKNILAQKRVERHQQKMAAIELQHKHKAATMIQALVRKNLADIERKIRVLRKRMRQHEVAKQREIACIQQWKNWQMRKIQITVEKELMETYRIKATARVNLDAIEELRDEHFRLQNDHDQLQEDTQQLQDDNDHLKQEIDRTRQATSIARTALVNMNKESTMWRFSETQYEERTNEFQVLVEQRDLKVLLEQHLHRLYRRTVRSMIFTIGKRDYERRTARCVLRLLEDNNVRDRLTPTEQDRTEDEEEEEAEVPQLDEHSI